jgi:uncharacterized membrane protein YgcG
MSRSQALLQATLRNPLLWGAAATAGFYAAIDAGLLEHPLVGRYLAGHWAAYICVGMFFIGLAALAIKGLELASQFEVLRLTLIDDAPPGRPMSDCAPLIARLDKQPARVHGTYLFQRLRTAIDYLSRKGTTETLEDELRTLSDLDTARKHASYGVVRMMIWAIPFIGSLGTVVGIGKAVANLSPEASTNLISAVAQSLEMVFDTTALALALSVVLMLGVFVCDQIENRLLLAIDARVNRELIGCFKAGATLKSVAQQATPGNLPEIFMGAVEKLVERQAELWQASLDAIKDQLGAAASGAGGQGGNGNGGGSGGGSGGGGNGGGGGGSFVGLSGDAGAWQEALMRSASIAAAQQVEMAIQNEIMQQLIEVIGQESLNWPVRRSRMFKAGIGAVLGDFEAPWADKS